MLGKFKSDRFIKNNINPIKKPIIKENRINFFWLFFIRFLMHSLNPISFASSNESTSCFTIVLFNFFVDESSKTLIKILLPFREVK